MERSQYKTLAEIASTGDLGRIDQASKTYDIIKNAYREIAVPDEEFQHKIQKHNSYQSNRGFRGLVKDVMAGVVGLCQATILINIPRIIHNGPPITFPLEVYLTSLILTPTLLQYSNKRKLRKSNKELATILNAAYNQAHYRETNMLPEGLENFDLHRAIRAV